MQSNLTGAGTYKTTETPPFWVVIVLAMVPNFPYVTTDFKQRSSSMYSIEFGALLLHLEVGQVVKFNFVIRHTYHA